MREIVKRVARVDSLTPEQQAAMPGWRDKWIEIGLRTGPADRPAFEKHVAACYRAAGLEPPKRVVWVPSPFVLAFAAPAAALSLEWRKAIAKDPRVATALLRGLPPSGAVRVAVDGAVGDAVRVAVGDAVGGGIAETVVSAIQQAYYNYIGGQFWVGWYWGGPAFVSFFREVCGLDLGDDMNARAKAYAGTCESACWWWPHRDFVMVSERPSVIRRDDAGRLHSHDGPAIAWSDGFRLYRSHGVTVPADVIERPESITVARVDAEQNAEVRRVMIERYVGGPGKYLEDSGATLVHEDEWGKLYRRELPGDEPIVMVRVLNSTPEPDGSTKVYWLRVHPELRPLPQAHNGHTLGKPQKMTARGAVASTFGYRAEEYAPSVQT